MTDDIAALVERLEGLLARCSEPEPERATIDSAERPMASYNAMVMSGWHARLASARRDLAAELPTILTALRAATGGER